MAQLPLNVYGDPTAWTRSLGRANNVLVISDSIALHWYPQFIRLLPKVRGHDGQNTAGGMAVPNNGLPLPPWASRSLYASQRSTTGNSTLSGVANIGATTLNLNPVTAGWCGNGMAVTITQGANTETINANAEMGGSQGGARTISLSSALTKAYTAGAVVTWQRPSGVAAYCYGTIMETVFNAQATPPTNDPYYFGNGRVVGFQYADSSGTVDEAQYNHDAGFGNSALKFTHYYLAHQKANPANIWKFLLGYGNSGGVAYDPAGTPFNTYSLTPAIRSVSATLPAQGTYDKTHPASCHVMPSGLGSFAAGDVYVGLNTRVEQVGATDGYTFMLHGVGGMWLEDYSGTLPSQLPQGMSPAFIAQLVQQAGIDTVMMQLGHNGWKNQGETDADIIAAFQTIIANFRAGNPQLKAILLGYHSEPDDVTGALADASRLMRIVAESTPGVLAIDLHAQMPNAALNNLYLSDRQHPTDGIASGSSHVANALIGLLDECDAYSRAVAADPGIIVVPGGDASVTVNPGGTVTLPIEFTFGGIPTDLDVGPTFRLYKGDVPVSSPTISVSSNAIGSYQAVATLTGFQAGDSGALVASGGYLGKTYLKPLAFTVVAGGANSINAGPVTVDWNYGGGNYSVTRGHNGPGIRGVEVVAYVASEYAAGKASAVPRGVAVTNDAGQWFGMGLTSGVTYTLVAYPNDSGAVKTMSLTVV